MEKERKYFQHVVLLISVILKVWSVIPNNFFRGYEIFPFSALSSLCNRHPTSRRLERIAHLHVHKSIHASCRGGMFKFSYTEGKEG